MIRQVNDFEVDNNIPCDIEKITGQRPGEKEPEYLVRWKGYPAEYDTWELQSSLGPPKNQLIAEFRKSFNITRKLENGNTSLDKQFFF